MVIMLDSKMTSLSPATPISILSECYGIWDHENLSSSIVTRFESSDIMDFIQPSLNTSTNLDSQAIIPLHNAHLRTHGPTRTDYFQNPTEYLTPLGNDPYSPTDAQLLHTFHSIPNLHLGEFQKTSDTSGYSESYDNFIPDLTHEGQQTSSEEFPPPFDVGERSGGEVETGGYLMEDCGGNRTHQEYSLWEGLNCDQGLDYPFLRKGDSPMTSDMDSEIDSKSSRESLSTFTEISRHGSPPKRRVGRPPKKDKKLKRATEKKTGRLWEFIRDLLKNPDYCPSLVRWENPEEGHFRFVNSEKVAQLWGQIKGNPRMTYEKLSRAMRYYYKSHVFEPVLGRRLVYKFGYNATNWRPINPNFVQNLYN